MQAYTLEIIVVALGIAMLLIEAFVKIEDKRSLAWLGILGLLVTLCFLFKVEGPTDGEGGVFWSFYTIDPLAKFYKGIALLTTIFVLLMSIDYSGTVLKYISRPEKGAHPQSGLGEFFALPVLVCAGLMAMASANNLVSIFVALETVTIGFYILVTYMRRNAGSLEAGVKYLILGALSTGFLVYGLTWLFGVTGSMELPSIGARLASGEVNTTAGLFAFALILVALGFKVGAAPFQLWIPDVYQGAPTPITAFLSVASKAAGFIVLLRISSLFFAAPEFAEKAAIVFAVLAALTLIYGNLVALPQKNFKRLLAFSSIAHAGFLLMAFAAAGQISDTSSVSMKPATVVSFYLGAYLLMTLLAFYVLSIVRTRRESEELSAYAGLAKTDPFLAFALVVSMASLAGIPLTAGFWGKFYVFMLAIEQNLWPLVVVGLICAAAGFYYYFKVVASMFFGDVPEGVDATAIRTSTVAKIVISLLIAMIILVGFAPKIILGLL